VTRYAPKLQVTTVARQLPRLPLSSWYTNYLMSCQLVPDRDSHDLSRFRERAPNLALDRLEDACPALLQPRRAVTFVVGDDKNGYSWVRRYSNTDMLAWVQGGRVKVQRLVGGARQQDAGPELAWEKAALPVACGWRDGTAFLRAARPR
jgi:hypothetical protein